MVFFLENPFFVLKKCSKILPKKIRDDWLKIIQMVRKEENEYTNNLQCKILSKNISKMLCQIYQSRQKYYKSPLYKSIAFGDIPLFKFILKNLDGFNFQKNNPLTPIQYAARKQQAEILQILLDHLMKNGPMENFNDPYPNKFTPIQWAAKNGHTKIVRILAPLTKNPNETEINNMPIHYAAKNGHYEILKILVPLT